MLHPILADRRRLAVYLLFALLLGLLMAGVVVWGGGAPIVWSLEFALPLTILLASQSLASWYLVRALPTESTPWPRLAASWLGALVVSVALWTAIGLAWTAALLSVDGVSDARRAEILVKTLPILVLVGTAGVGAAVLGHYLFAAVERSRDAERRAHELALAARDAELKSLKAQLDPHFLFNSLNSVAALIGTDPRSARRMCFLMSGFFRKSLGLGRRESIPLSEEIYLAETFLAIEQVRFGERLRTRFEVDETALALAVPPLVLQPLVENAVHHGIAHLVEGGEVLVRARRVEGRLVLEVENPCDPDRPASRGAGVGLSNVRSRLEALYGHRCAVEVEPAPERYRVRALLPVEAPAS